MLHVAENMVITTVKIVQSWFNHLIFIILIRHGGSEVNIQSCRNECESFSPRVFFFFFFLILISIHILSQRVGSFFLIIFLLFFDANRHSVNFNISRDLTIIFCAFLDCSSFSSIRLYTSGACSCHYLWHFTFEHNRGCIVISSFWYPVNKPFVYN